MAKTRIRIKGKSIGQIEEGLLSAYQEITHYKKLNPICEGIIGNAILGRPVETIEDLELAEALVHNVYYENIGEFLEAYIRSEIRSEFRICQNCNLLGKCRDSKSPYYTCKRFAKHCGKRT